MENRKLISATDTQYSGTLLASLNEQRIHGLFCDVTVVVEDKKFRAHKNILSASSTYFHQRLSHASQVVELSCVRASIFAEILNYIYSSKIVRVRSDLLEELIKSGQLLGVKFIADLGVPLSQVKSLGSGNAKSNNPESSFSDSSEKVIDLEKISQGHASRNVPNKGCDMDVVSVIPEATKMTSTKFQECKKSFGSNEKMETSDLDEDDDDVIFCSEVIPPKSIVSNDSKMEQQKSSADVELSSLEAIFNNTILHKQFVPIPKSPNNLLLNDVPYEMNSSSINSRGAYFGPAQKHLPNQVRLNSAKICSFTSRDNSPTNNLLVNPQLSNDTLSSNTLIISDGTYASRTSIILDSQIHQSNTKKSALFEVPKQKNTPKSTFSQELIAKSGELKSKDLGITTVGNKDCVGGKLPGSQHITDRKKIITLDTPSKIEELSTGCKVYENIGEDTFDIVIPIKGDAEDDEDDDGAVALPRSIDGSPNSKRMKLKHEDHYELSVDGKIYYICIVCKRSYLSITTLKRHYNCHSWEKKYPCHYCEKIFPMAELRTKHEILHTGERRYECLICGDSFINYPMTISHIKSVHGKDPSGNGKLYHLHPSRTLPIRPYNYAADAQPTTRALPKIKDEVVYNIDSDDDKKEGTESEGPEVIPTDNQLIWEDLFVQEENQLPSKPRSCEGSSEFEFVIPESY